MKRLGGGGGGLSAEEQCDEEKRRRSRRVGDGMERGDRKGLESGGDRWEVARGQEDGRVHDKVQGASS